jgi:TonB family protein
MRQSLLVFWVLLATILANPAHGQERPVAADSNKTKRYSYTEKMPVFPILKPADSTRSAYERVIDFLNKDLHFPAKALRDGVQGKVFFSFVVDEAGRTTNIKLVKGLREDVDAEVLRNAHRLETIQWQPGTQNDRPVRVAFTVPISFSVSSGPMRAGTPGSDSLDLPRFNKLKLPTSSWSLAKAPPAGHGVLYGSCLQRMGASSSGIGQYVRLVNLSTGQVFRINVKPIMRSRRENPFCYALPAGRYALSQYEFNSSTTWLVLTTERLCKPLSAAPASVVASTRFLFTIEPGKVHYVGTWNFANENEPLFSNEKALLDPVMLADYPQAELASAKVAIPK